jgi:hypothetical protein
LLPPGIPQPLILLVPGGYDQAGTVLPGDDNYVTPPLAVTYWREDHQKFTGAHAHAYATHNLLNRRLVVPIPDLWMLGVAAVLGKGLSLLLRSRGQRWPWWLILVAASGVYGMLSLQLYISVAVLLPWLLPSAAFWIYVLPALRRKPHG